MIEIKILSYHSAQRYALKQTVIAAKHKLREDYPELTIAISELKDWQSIEHYTPILAAPSLVINEKLVCKGRNPSRDEVVAWIQDILGEKQ